MLLEAHAAEGVETRQSLGLFVRLVADLAHKELVVDLLHQLVPVPDHSVRHRHLGFVGNCLSQISRNFYFKNSVEQFLFPNVDWLLLPLPWFHFSMFVLQRNNENMDSILAARGMHFPHPLKGSSCPANES